MTLSDPQVRLATLPRADGSATYTYGGYTVTGFANGPIDAQRRDEDPDEANVDVIVRPDAGVGGPSERNLESILQKTLQEIILVQDFPRCSIQVVLQIQDTPSNDYVITKLNQPGLNLVVLPALLQTAVLALLSASIPMRTTATSAVLAILPAKNHTSKHTIVNDPSPQDVAAAQSIHVFAFSGEDDELLLAESDGAFTMGQWDEALAAAVKICCQVPSGPGDMAVDDAGPDMRGFLRNAAQSRVEEVLRWKVTQE